MNFDIRSVLFKHGMKPQGFSIDDHFVVRVVTEDLFRPDTNGLSKKKKTPSVKSLIVSLLHHERVLKDLENLSHSISKDGDAKQEKWLVPTPETITCITKSLRVILGDVYSELELSVFGSAADSDEPVLATDFEIQMAYFFDSADFKPNPGFGSTKKFTASCDKACPVLD